MGRALACSFNMIRNHASHFAFVSGYSKSNLFIWKRNVGDLSVCAFKVMLDQVLERAHMTR